jgi:tRNA modification GTPase
MTDSPTIFALSSGTVRSGIAVVRLSGPAASKAVTAMCGALPPPRRFSLRKLLSADGSLIDQGVVIWLPGPNTATGEDMAELHVHGSRAVIERLIGELSCLEGLRLAEPGEFTRRAFDNERIGLLEVEGLGDLLAAESEAQRRLAMRQFSGQSAGVIEGWRKDLMSALAMLEAAIDFADEDDVAGKAIASAQCSLETLKVRLEEALASAARLSALRRGPRIVIAGPPNAGKSTLLNWLAGREAAIVSSIPGTTRDVVEAPILLAGVPVVLADTAGLRDDSADAIEREGMARSRAALREADLLIWIEAVDARLDPPAIPDIRLMNKSDLETTESIHNRNESVNAVRISAKTGERLVTFRHELERRVLEIGAFGENDVITRERHRASVSQSIRFVNDALMCRPEQLELMAEDVRNAARALGQMTGRIDVEELLGQIFQDFCIGK